MYLFLQHSETKNRTLVISFLTFACVDSELANGGAIPSSARGDRGWSILQKTKS